jgi:WD40 repeat protein
VGSVARRGGKKRAVHVAIVLMAALLLLGCGTADREPADRSRTDDAGFIVFSNYAEGSGGYYAIRPDGTGLRALPFDAEELALSADGRVVATKVTSFEHDEIWGEERMFVSRLDGSERRPVPLPDGAVGAPSLSPDGSRLALVYTADPFSGSWDVATVSVGGADFTRLTSSGGAEHVAWSSDGERIAFVDRPVVDDDGSLDEIGGIYVMGEDGTNLRRIARGEDPAWSPDGKRIALTDADRNIAIVDPDGGRPEIVAPEGRSPMWSPDGEQLAFLRVTDCGHATCNSGLFIVSLGRGPARRIGPRLFEPTLVAWTPANLAGA